MKITPQGQALSDLTPMEAAHFIGKAGSHPLLTPSSPLPTSCAVVRFEAGARNHWHAHAGGQLLFVIEGEGWVQARGSDPQRVRLGDAIVVAPNEEHWHGAGARGRFAHLVTNLGETRWLEASPQPPD
jgi:quercetin dioxygenase-like cupin family protein